MNLSKGRQYLATPGPSIIPDQVLRAMQRPAPDIYKGEIVDLTEEIKADISNFAGTHGQTAIYISNGHGVWEASLVNLFQPKDKILIVSNGHFGNSWARLAERLNIDVEIMDFGTDLAADPNKIEYRLRSDKLHEIKGLLVVHSDTSTSIKNNLYDIRSSISKLF